MIVYHIIKSKNGARFFPLVPEYMYYVNRFRQMRRQK